MREVITADQMVDMEAKSIQEGASAKEYMKSAGRALAEVIKEYLCEHELEKGVLLLVGKGNNGGDALVAGALLLKEKYPVRAYALDSDERLSELNKYYRKKFEKNGGSLSSVKSADEMVFDSGELIVDGLVGTGYRGGLKGLLAEVVRCANEFEGRILSIDIPSGVDGNTGNVGSVAIEASVTAYLEYPKVGSFINAGFNHVGSLVRADFGLDPKYIKDQEAIAHLVHAHTLSPLLPKMKRRRHKYDAGYVLGFAASKEMPGAAALSTIAALKSGAGIVRLFTPEPVVCSSLAPEVIHDHYVPGDLSRVMEELKRARSIYLGPGLGRSGEAQKLVKGVLEAAHQPCVIDADALMVMEGKDFSDYDQPLILTPHYRECLHLLDLDGAIEEREMIERVRLFAEDTGAVIVLKGAPTFIFSPGRLPMILAHGHPAMATAGSGDVLTGMIAAFLAQGVEVDKAAQLGVTLHALSGEIAAVDKSEYCVIASDLIDYLPDAFRHLRNTP